MHELAARLATRPEAASTGTPLCQDGQPSTRDISGPVVGEGCVIIIQ